MEKSDRLLYAYVTPDGSITTYHETLDKGLKITNFKLTYHQSGDPMVDRSTVTIPHDPDEAARADEIDALLKEKAVPLYACLDRGIGYPLKPWTGSVLYK